MTIAALAAAAASCALFAAAPQAGGAGAPAAALAAEWNTLRPILESRCYDCHGGDKTKGGVDLKALHDAPGVEKHFELWQRVHEAVESGEMPPKKSKPLADADKQRLVQWVTRALDAAAHANAGDPGPVTLRRLTNAEYDYTVRDLTGVDFHLGKDFLADGGGGEGFANTGDILFTSPQQLGKYLDAARQIADHATILPGTGVTFSPTRVGLRGPDQLKAQAEQALYVWYQKMAAPHLPRDEENLREADYMLACWLHKHRALTGAGTLAQLATEMKLKPAFLDNWWKLLTESKSESRYLNLTVNAWRDLPGPDAKNPRQVPPAVLAKLKEIDAQRKSWYASQGGGWASVQRVQQDVDHLRGYTISTDIAGQGVVHVVVADTADGNAGDHLLFSRVTLHRGKQQVRYLDWLRKEIDEAEKLIAKPETGEEKKKELAARIEPLKKVRAMFGHHPAGRKIEDDGFYAQAPAIVDLPVPKDATHIKLVGRLDLEAPDRHEASAQFIVTAGTPPSPTSVLPGVITLWHRQTERSRQIGAEFGRMKSVFPDEYERRLEEVARNYHGWRRDGGVYYFSDDQLRALISDREKQRHAEMLEDWRYVRSSKLAKPELEKWDERVRQHVENFAARAWRRPLTDSEKKKLAKVYADGRAAGLSQETAAREAVVLVLVSPNFLFKLESADQPGEHPVTAWELATRLSYFLWSSGPDAELRRVAADGSLKKPEVLQAQVTRMLKDARAEALAREFAGQWLAFHGFDKHGTVDAEKFPEFTAELRRDLYAEAVSFIAHIIRSDRPVREILHADYTFLNERLAKFYGIPGVTGDELRLVKVDPKQRGGVMGMASVLTKTSYPHRTSPVLRGNWVLHNILGAPTPPPPNDVPQLDESAAKPASLRERLAMHRADAACASCHDKIDPLGFPLEGYDAIGRLRSVDEFGKPVDISAEMKGGASFAGLDGLRGYLASREDEILTYFNRKLIGYALGRSVLPSDRVLMTEMTAAIKKNEGRFSAAVQTLVASRQFQNRRND